MKRHVLIYGLLGGILIAVLKWTEYRFLVIEHSIEIYGGLTAVTFAVLGIWLGLKLTRTKEKVVVKEIIVAAGEPFVPDERKREDLGITRREFEILELIAQGMSNREIAEPAVRQRKHGEDPFEPCFRQIRSQATDAGGAARQGIRAASLNYSRERMIFLSRSEYHPKG